MLVFASGETNKDRRQRTPAVVALISEGFSSETDPAAPGRVCHPPSEFDAGTFRNTDLMCGVTRGYDAGETFRFATFNIAGAPDATLLPVTQAGELIDCRSGGLRLAIHSGSNQGGRFGLRSFRNATRLVTQPAFAARNGTLYLAWNNSTSTIFGDPNSNSTILFMRSIDGGNTWSNAVEVNPAVASDTQHVLPSLAIDSDPNDVHIGYYTQHNDRTLDVDPTPVSSLGFTQSGLAICNPNNSPVNLTFQLHDSSGLVVASATKTLPALGHMAQFFTDLFGGFDQFEGTVEVTSSGGPVSGVALRYDNPGGTVFATNPVIPLP